MGYDLCTACGKPAQAFLEKLEKKKKLNARGKQKAGLAK